MDTNITPMLLKSGKPFDSPDYVFELKLDGVRCLAFLDAQTVILKSRRGRDITALFPELCDIWRCVGVPCVLDGELVALKDGKPDLYELLRRTRGGAVSPGGAKAEYAVFDILFFDGLEITNIPLLDRKKILLGNVSEQSRLTLVPFLENCGILFFELTKRQGLEGIVAKKKDSPYVVGKRTDYWIKIK